jgi:hypothetical protein
MAFYAPVSIGMLAQILNADVFKNGFLFAALTIVLFKIFYMIWNISAQPVQIIL